MNLEPTVYVIDDDAAVRDGLRTLLRAARFSVETFADAESFLRTPIAARLGCLILDLKMPRVDGIELQRELSLRGSQLPIVFVSAYATVETTVRAMKNGAVHFLAKPFDPAELVRLIEEILRETAARQHQWLQLSDRERQVMTMLAAGLGTKSIAQLLDISTRTVETHRSNLMSKLKVRTALELANAAHAFDLSAYGSA